mmetsp:Transcript_31781/g.48787  ORF Transcript_31781/g.48787 Transcript_31781/m.48787 type:complete len:226 (+) Transcript_31781:1365-2042(+)
MAKVLDPLQIGYSKSNNLEACLKCFERENPSEEVSVVVKKNEKYDLMEYDELLEKELTAKESGGGALEYNLANMEQYVLSAARLLELCKDITSLNKLYVREFSKIESYDEEEECTVQPEHANGYKFELYINSFFQFCPHQALGVLKVNREGEFCCLREEEDLDEGKASLLAESSAYLQEVLVEKEKFKGKQIEVNLLACASRSDTLCEKYSQRVNEYLVALDRNK